jgi:hypothetical protein
MRLDPPVRDQPDQRHEHVQKVGNPVVDEPQRDGSRAARDGNSPLELPANAPEW